MHRLPTILIVPPAVYTILVLAWHPLRRYLLEKIGIGSLPLLTRSRRSDQKVQGTAIICGGSITGLLAARICHEHFERVLIVEAEPWVATEDGQKIDGFVGGPRRSRVMQYASLHVCQSFLFSGLKYLFPDIEEECARSAIRILPHDPRIHLSGARLRFPMDVLRKTLRVSRAGFETLLRRLVLDRSSYPNIEHITGTVTDVLPDPNDPSRLGKVVIRKDTSGTAEEISAALVADCTGPARTGLKWLGRHGYGVSSSYPKGTLPLDQLKISFDQKLRYSSITFCLTPELCERVPLPKEIRNKLAYSFMEDATEETLARGRSVFTIMRNDGDQIVVFTGHYGTNKPQPNNVAEMREYLLGLYAVEPIPDWLFRMLDMMEEIEESAVVSLVKVPPTTHVRYHLATNLPSNFIALGDSVMTVNPLFGEGCTKALRCALALQIVLLRAQGSSAHTLPTNFSSDFFKEENAKTDWLWENTRIMGGVFALIFKHKRLQADQWLNNTDYGAPDTETIPGESLSSGAFARWYAKWLQRLALTDDHAKRAMYGAVAGFASPIDAIHPNLLIKTLWRAMRG